jgi:acyl-coenzyme A thioesterase PaaI-like protein
MSPRLLRWVMNVWPPFLGAGIRVRSIAADWSEAVVDLRERLANRNYVGTHFGGSLFAMTDPFYALLLMHRLGERYLVWDQSASIEFVAPGRGTVHAVFRIPDETVDEIRKRTEGGEKALPEFQCEIRDGTGELVARVRKTIYVRLKARYRPA